LTGTKILTIKLHNKISGTFSKSGLKNESIIPEKYKTKEM
jgi:hypothetical protein